MSAVGQDSDSVSESANFKEYELKMTQSIKKCKGVLLLNWENNQKLFYSSCLHLSQADFRNNTII